jgi:hypothetical protein
MEQETKAILKVIPEETIYSFIDLAGLRRYLLDCPNMLVMFEVLINHIHEFKQLKQEHDMNSHLYQSSPI